MKSFEPLLRTRRALWLGLTALALAQTACAHPVVMEPSVVVQARIGGPVYGSVVYGPPPVVIAPAPVWLPPPAVVVAPRMVSPYPVYPAYPGPAYGRPWHGEHHGHGWGHRGW